MTESYLKNLNDLMRQFKFDQSIPKINDLSNYLKAKSGFQSKPVAGIVSQRQFLNCLVFKVFCCGQFIRHKEFQQFSLEPDIVHQYVGHIPSLADQRIAAISQQIGLMSLGASDKDLNRLGHAYLQSLQFGLCEQKSELKVYGAAICSCLADLKKIEDNKFIRIDFNPQAREHQQFDYAIEQNRFWVTARFQTAISKLHKLNQTLDKPFNCKLDQLTAKIKIEYKLMIQLYSFYCLIPTFIWKVFFYSVILLMNFEQALEQYFPRKPYSLQKEIAKELFTALDSNHTKLFILQSPTGTGKTFSLLCPLLYWLTRNRDNISKKQQPQKQSKFPSWLKRATEHKGEKLILQRQKAINEMKTIQQIVKLNKFRRSQVKVKQKDRQQCVRMNRVYQQIEVQSEQEQNQPINGKKSMKIQEKIIQKQLKVDSQNVLPKIIFVSRTHSQLAQVVESIKLILQKQPNLKYMQVASKQHLCINKNINQQKNSINQKCQHLLDNSKCSYFHQMEIKDFFNKTLDQTYQLGQANNLCPYYASRNLLEMVDVLCLPYSSILKRDIRNRLSINIHNTIVVFDEGHNLLQNDKQINSSQVKMEDMEIFAQQVDQYLKRYQDKFKIKNFRLFTHLLQILRSFIGAVSDILPQHKKSESQTKKYVKLNYIDFLLKLSLKQMKIYVIMKYFQLNNIDKKLSYFNSAQNNISKGKEQYVKNVISVAVVNQIMSFLLQFYTFQPNKQILLLKWNQSKKGCLKIMCFQSGQLQEIITKSKMTVIAGGTMQPLDELLSRTNTWKDRTVIKKCSHIIREQQCKIYIIKKNNAKELIFNHQSLFHINATQIFKPICTELMQKVIYRTEKGGGIVVFIQNYQLITFFKNVFKNQCYNDCIIYDSKEQNIQSQQKDIFSKYKGLVQSNTNKNYILFSVMGGKLSQGINFSDRLARSIVVFGLPYSNMYSAEIEQTMAYFDKKSTAQFTGKKYYESLCIKTLNQTIGRGIRHINDYANIYLCDYRFDDIKGKLSNWMRDRIEIINQLSNWK